MAQEIESTGLGSLSQIYMSIIPLSAEQRLPRARAMVESARQRAERQEQLQNWKEAGDAYAAHFRAAKSFPENDVKVLRATATLMEYLRTIIHVIERRKVYDSPEYDT
jgi:hypothetical protein